MRIPLKLSKEKEFDAAGFGLNAVDHLIVVPEYPAFDTKVRFTDHQKSAGGQTASAMVALQRLGLKTAYAGRFGSDAEGRFGLSSLEQEGVMRAQASAPSSGIATSVSLTGLMKPRLTSPRADVCCTSMRTIRQRVR